VVNLRKYYNFLKEKDISKLLFKHSDIRPIIEKHRKNDLLEVSEVGKSFENREIYMIKAGNGKTKVMLWSQMHGNEFVGTMAIFDILNLFNSENSDLRNISDSLLQNLTIYFIPMLNPDGAEYETRRNAQSIDLNRDALALTAPESRILENLTNNIKPDFAFNLHDQEIYYGTENSENTVALSFLTPSYDYEKTIDLSRQKSMKLIADIFRMLQNEIPGQVGKYNDSYMPNAFGDNIQKKGISTILVEAGYIHGDVNRQKVRELYTTSLVFALNSISEKKYLNNNIDTYKKIPFNIKLKFCDYILKNITIIRKTGKFKTDIAIIRNILDSESFTDLSEDFIIWDIGDLSNKSAFKTIDFRGKEINDQNNQIKRLKKANFLFMLMKAKKIT